MADVLQKYNLFVTVTANRTTGSRRIRQQVQDALTQGMTVKGKTRALPGFFYTNPVVKFTSAVVRGYKNKKLSPTKILKKLTDCATSTT